MIGGSNKRDFFLSRRGSVAHLAREVEGVLAEQGYTVVVQDYDIPLGTSFVDAMHEAIKNSRDLIVLYTSDYENSPFTRKEFTSFEAERHNSSEERRIVVLRCEEVPLRGLLADNVYQDLVGVADVKERARRIVAAVEGRSQAERPPARAFVGVPARIASFTGRENAFDRVDSILTSKEPNITTHIGRAAILGMGGIGKTSFAIEYAYRFRSLYAGVWWCHAESRKLLLSELANLAAELGAAPIAMGVAEDERAAKDGLRRLAEQRATWLIIYDDVASPEVVIDLFPTAGARILLTSRFPDWAEWAEEVPLDTLPAEEAAAFLQARAKQVDDIGARTLAGALGGLPLALNHAAAYCQRTGLGFPEYAEQAMALIEFQPRAAAYPRSVAATFDMAISEAVRQAPAAETVMAYLAYCEFEFIPIELIEGALGDKAQRNHALITLFELSLLKYEPLDERARWVKVHPLVRAVARNRSEVNGNAAKAWQSILLHLSVLFPKLTFTGNDWDLLGSELRETLENIRHSLYHGEIDDGERYFEARGEEEPPEFTAYKNDAWEKLQQTKHALILLTGAPW